MDLGERWKSGLHHPVSVYAKQVTQGKLRAQCCQYEILACRRHLDDLRRQGTDILTCPHTYLATQPLNMNLYLRKYIVPYLVPQ